MNMDICIDMYEAATRAVGKFSENALGYSISEKDMNRGAIKGFYNEKSCRLVYYGCTSWGMRGHYLYRRDDDKCFDISKKNNIIQGCNEISWEDVKVMSDPLFEGLAVESVALPSNPIMSLRLGAPHPTTKSSEVLDYHTVDL